jgi:small basic protein (TIGR04137 family)
MSMHKSLKIYPFKNKHRSIRKRYERFRSLKLQQKWDEEHSSVFAMPKEKRFKKKPKKEKKEETTDEQKTIL